MTKKEKIFLWFIATLYLLSWVSPILPSSGASYFWGFDGAIRAIMQFGEGWSELFTSTREHATLYALARIFRGSCNFLFIACFIFLFFKPRISLYLSSWSLLSMVDWWEKDVLVGYYLWCIAGFLLVIFSVYLYRRTNPDNSIWLKYGVISILLPIAYKLMTLHFGISPK